MLLGRERREGAPCSSVWCLEGGAVPGVQTPIPSSLVPCSHSSSLERSSAVDVGAGGGPLEPPATGLFLIVL